MKVKCQQQFYLCEVICVMMMYQYWMHSIIIHCLCFYCTYSIQLCECRIICIGHTVQALVVCFLHAMGDQNRDKLNGSEGLTQEQHEYNASIETLQ